MIGRNGFDSFCQGLIMASIGLIIADIIIMLLKDIPGKLEDDGIFLASGIIKERQADIEAAAKEVGMQVDHVDEKGGWVVMQMSKVK